MSSYSRGSCRDGATRRTSQLRRMLVVVWGILFTASTLLMGATGAQAYIPNYDIQADAGGEGPRLASTIVHSQVDGRDPLPGESFTYTAATEITNLAAQQGEKKVTLVYHFSSQAPTNGAITAGSFSVPSGWSVAPDPNTCGAGTTECRVTLTIPANSSDTGKVTLNVGATVSQDVKPSSSVVASVEATLVTVPKLAIEPGQPPKFFQPDTALSCQGTFNFKATVKGGGWLADIKFADAEGRGNIILNDEPLTATNPKSKITVTDASGRDITAEILNTSVFKNPDPTPPTVSTVYTTLFPQAIWLQSMNWEVNPDNFTGKTWIPDGATITISKWGKHRACVAGFATDWDTTRPLEVAIEAVRPALPVTDLALDGFGLPGDGSNLNYCEAGLFAPDSLAANQTAKAASMNLGVNLLTGFTNPPTQNTTATYVFTPRMPNGGPATTDSIALTQFAPDRIYYLAQNGTNSAAQLMYYASDGTYRQVGNRPVGVSFAASRFAIGFDPFGTLWGIYRAGTQTSPRNYLYRLPLFDANGAENPNAQWEAMGEIPEWAGTQQGIKDLIFDTEGNMYYLMYSELGTIPWDDPTAGALGRVGIVMRLKRDVILNPGRNLPNSVTSSQYLAATIKVGEGITDGRYDFYGLTWGPDGYLYGASASYGLFKIPPNLDGRPIRIGDESRSKINTPDYPTDNSFFRGKPFDLGSCNFGPTFSIDKAAVDPVTGQVSEPGTATANAVTFDAIEKRGKVGYVVNVRNPSSEPQAPRTYREVQGGLDPKNPGDTHLQPVVSWVEDEFKLPTGFSPTSVVIDNVRFVANGDTWDVICPAGSTLYYPQHDPNSGKYSAFTDGEVGCKADGRSDHNGIWFKLFPVSERKIWYTAVAAEESGAPAELIPAQSSKAHTVMIDVTAGADADWDAAGDCGLMAGDQPYGGGFYNQVNMQPDKDGFPNNYGCVPGIPTTSRTDAHLKLIKNIAKDGQPVAGHEDDAQYFTLTATREGTIVPIEGTSRVSGQVAVDQDVAAGTYFLAEYVNKAGSTVDNATGEIALPPYVFGTTWLCTKEDGSSATTGTSGGAPTVTLEAGDNVTCQIENYPKSGNFHARKIATSPVSTDSPHVGTPVPYNESDMTFRYTIEVVNDGNETASSGQLTDTFIVPAGMKWKPGATATVGFDANGTAATASGLTESAPFTEDKLKNGVVLATSINNVPAKGTVRFTVAIPLVPDLSQSATPEHKTVYEERFQNLKECTVDTASRYITSTTNGVVNSVTLEREKQPDVSNVNVDNKACIPVGPPPKFSVKKVATDPVNPPSALHVGQVVPFDLKRMDFKYSIEVQNDNDAVGNTGALTDVFKLPEGMTWAKCGEVGNLTDCPVKVTFTATSGVTFIDAAGVEHASGYGFTVDKDVFLSESYLSEQTWPENPANGYQFARSVKGLGGSPAKAIFRVEVPLAPDLSPSDVPGSTNFQINIERLKSCQARDVYYPATMQKRGFVNTEGGVPNQVHLVGESKACDVEYWYDNMACIPVGEPPLITDVPNIPLTGGLSQTQVMLAGLIIALAGAGWFALDTVRRRGSFQTD